MNKTLGDKEDPIKSRASLFESAKCAMNAEILSWEFNLEVKSVASKAQIWSQSVGCDKNMLIGLRILGKQVQHLMCLKQ